MVAKTLDEYHTAICGLLNWLEPLIGSNPFHTKGRESGRQVSNLGGGEQDAPSYSLVFSIFLYFSTFAFRRFFRDLTA